MYCDTAAAQDAVNHMNNKNDHDSYTAVFNNNTLITTINKDNNNHNGNEYPTPTIRDYCPYYILCGSGTECHALTHVYD